MNQDITIRKFTNSDTESCAIISNKLGWPMTVNDWNFASVLGLGTVVEKSAELVGVGFIWPFKPDHYTLGLMIVSSDHQRQGIGKLIMQHLLDAAGESQIRLNATIKGLPLYRKLGFNDCGFIHQHQGYPTKIQMPPNANIRTMTAIDFDNILIIDKAASGLDRSTMLQLLAKFSSGIVIENQQGISGFAFCRKSGLGETIGPVIATSPEDAQDLMHYFINQAEGFLRIDLEIGADSYGDFLTKAGLPMVNEIVAMKKLKMDNPTTPNSNIIALVSQALG
ncbi:MAG: hypothetical protein COB24_09460 [Hyphomicrobiales bacterium]|nr:MAG: hypothetical protein COB24_09460 [Hyphomicrobiales bacterium]